MKHLFKDWEKLKPQIAQKRLLVFLDYDGTLTPIAPTPRQAVLPRDTKKMLQKLSALRDCQVIIISGRQLEELRKMVAVPGLTYIGNHGLEIKGPLTDFHAMISRATQQALMRIKRDLEHEREAFPGLLIEDKRLTMSIHYRLVDERKGERLQKVLRKITIPHIKTKDIKVTAGKKVFEIRPPFLWDKGKAVNWILKQAQSQDSEKTLPIVLGDDMTDEDAFAAVGTKGVTVVVGAQRRSRAQYYLQDPPQVVNLLELIWKVKKGSEA